MTVMDNKKRDISLDILRIIACFMVVGIHTTAQGWYIYPPRTYTWTILNFYDTLFRPGVPLFLMISGCLFLRKDKIDIKRLWIKNIFHLAVIYIVWAVIYAAAGIGIRKAVSEPKQIFEIVFGPNPQYHLWYLRTLMNLYAIAPFLWVLVRAMNGKLVRYYLILFFIFGLLRTTVYELPFIPAWLHEQINLFMGMDLVGYSGYFILGYFLSDKEITSKYSIKNLSVVYCITVLLAAGLNQLIAWIDNWPTLALYNDLAIPVAIESICLFLMIRKISNKYELSLHTQNWINKLSESTLFIYLIHVMILQRLEIYFHLKTTNYNVLLSVPLFVIVIFCFSAVAGMLLKRIPVLNKIL